MAAAARLGIPAVAVYQTDLAGYARTYMGAGEATAWRRIRSVHAAADRTLVPSTASLRDLEAHGVPRLELWPRGVDTVRFRPGHRDEALRRELAPDGELIVGYVGRLAPEKHVELLAGVCGLPGVRVVVVGDGPSRPGLEEALPGAAFLGRRTGDDLARIFASLDVFAHTGPFETFCQTVQEAMASGVPVVAPAAGGPLDLVDHGRTGLLVPPRDADAVRDAVASLAADPVLRAAYGAAARATVEGRTWAAVGDRLIEHYEDVLAARKAVLAA
jgi:phosphatidylinositol alpha 1,6-mannosyltransferase